jgi:hypothetical protein
MLRDGGIFASVVHGFKHPVFEVVAAADLEDATKPHVLLAIPRSL